MTDESDMRIKVDARRKLSIPALLALVAAIAVAAWVRGSSGTGTGANESAPMAPSVSPAPSMSSGTAAVELGRFPLGGSVSRLAYDSTRDAIWFAFFDVTGPDFLYRVDAATGQRTQYSIPDTDYNGYLTTIRVATDGSVWFNEPYRMVRFDPVTQTSRALDLAVDDPSALPDALNPGNPVPGTWISAFAFLGTGVAMARTNDPHLYLLDQNLKVTGTISVPRTYAGALDLTADPVGDGLYVLPGLGRSGGVALLSRTGTVLSNLGLQGRRLQSSGSSVLLSGTRDGGTWLTGVPSGAPVQGSTFSGDSLAVPSANGDTILYNATNGILERVGAGRIISSLALAQSDVFVPRPGGDVTAHSVPLVNDLVTDDHGVTWYIDGGTNELVKVKM